MGYRQTDKLLRISTFLDNEEKKIDGDPLLLGTLDGTEGISRLYSYDVTILRDADSERPPLDLTRLINAEVYLGARQSNDKHVPFLYRVGVFESLQESTDIDKTKIWPITVRQFHIFRGRVVPPVKLLSRDICYRVFEGKSVLDIIEAVKADIKNTFPSILIDTSALSAKDFPPMDYCVQYGESTLDFLSRLMARFGIGYYFGHKTGADNLLNETMILQSYYSFGFPECRNKKMQLDDDPTEHTVASVTRYYQPAQSKFSVGAANPIRPTEPFVSEASIAPQRDMLRPHKNPWFGTTTFGDPVFSTDEAHTSAEVHRMDAQSEVVLISGKSRNGSFLSGHSFEITPHDDDDDKALINHTFIIDSFNISVHDYNYVNIGPWPLLDVFFNTFSTFDSDSTKLSDASLAKVSTWVSNCAQNWAPPIFPNTTYFGQPTPPGVLNIPSSTKVGDLVDKLVLQPLWGFMWLCIQGIDLKRMVADWKNEAGYANSFFAIPAVLEKSAFMRSFPLPLAPRPVARGPETAVVIGPNGTDTSAQDIYADALGRVRIRFPWDPGPPQDQKLPPRYPVAQPDQPYKSGDNACWVRVVEGWAGRGFGTQFLPRIGQEVLVDFLHGDPERPVITGRLYNADSGKSNLPFPNDSITLINQVGDLSATISNYDTPFSGIKTRATLKPDGGDERYHLLRWDDTYNCEQTLIRSQGRYDLTAFANAYQTTYGNLHTKVVQGTDKNGQKFGGSSLTTVGGEYDLHVGGSHYEQTDKDHQITVKGDTSLDLEGKLTAVIGGAMSVGADSTVIEATNQITLKVGGSWIVIGPCGVYINGPMIYENSGGSPGQSSAVTMQNVGDAETAEPGDKAADRLTPCNPRPAGGGSRGTHTAQIQPAPPCTQHTGAVDCNWLGDDNC